MFNSEKRRRSIENFLKYIIDIDSQMSNFVIFQKELNYKWEAIGILDEGKIERESYQTKANPLTKQKQDRFNRSQQKVRINKVKKPRIINAYQIKQLSLRKKLQKPPY